MKYYELTDHFQVAADADRTWAFFSSALNLKLITPAWLNFTVHTPEPIDMRRDTLLDYTIRWMGLPVRWRTLVTDWSPPRSFSDLQIRGPYALWLHQHDFEPGGDGAGTLCRDRVIYAIPFGPLGTLAHAVAVRRQLLDIFRYRRKVIAEQLGWVRAVQDDVEIRRL